MRSGWPHTQEDPDSLASRQQAQFGPVDSWPNGYPALGNGDGDYRYPTHGMDPYAVEPATPPAPAGEHPYAAFGGAGYGAGGYTTPDIEAFGYGDPGYSNPGYDGPASQDAGIASTQTVRGTVESSAPHDGYYSGGGSAELAYPASSGQQPDQSLDIYHQPWDYNQPLRYDDEEPSYPLLDSRGETTHQPAAFDPAHYNGSEFSVPGIGGPGYDLSGIIGTGEFPGIGYDQPGYDRLSYDDPRYTDFPDSDAPRGNTRFDMPALEEPPRGNTRFDMPALDDFEVSRLDHVWPAREDLPGDADIPGDSLNRTSLDLGAEQPRMNQTRFDMPAVDDYQFGDRFAPTSADGMRALAPEAEFHPAQTEFHPAGVGLVAPAGEQPVSWADETSFDRFGEAPELDAEGVPAAFIPEGAPLQVGEDSGPREFGRRRVAREAQRAATGKRRGNSRDKREWVALGAIAVVAAGAIGGVLMKFVFSGQSGPTHTVSTPNKAANFTREPSLEKQMKVDQLRSSVIQSSGGKASDVVSGVYQQGSSTVGSNPQIYMFVGGKLANSDPQASVSNFEQTYKQGGAHVASAGSLGGEAACATSTVNGESVSMCVWFDNDTFGEFVSPTMTPAKLASTMVTARPNLEHLAH